jgi:phosphatidate phosphatase APP1
MKLVPRRPRLGRVTLGALTLMCAGIPAPGFFVGGDPSPVRSDERVVFFDTAGHFDPERDAWTLAVHGWVHEPASSRVRKKMIEETIEGYIGSSIEAADRPRFERRVDLFLADNEGGKRLEVEVGDRAVPFPASEGNGHFRHEVELTVEESASLTPGDAVGVRVHADDEERTFTGRIRLVGRQGLSVISDIDDTVKVSEVLDRPRLIRNTFVDEYRAVHGMADVYRSWAQSGVVFHYVSSSPWHLYEPLAEFLERSGFPRTSMHLKHVRLKDSSVLDILSSSETTKPPVIESVLAAFPERDFILVGDSGEKDPEVYAALLRAHPEQVVRVFIRNVTAASSDDARFAGLFEGVDAERWKLFTDPKEIAPLPEARGDRRAR